MLHESMRTSVTRRYFLKGIGLLSASAALAACAQSSQDKEEMHAGMETSAPLLAIIHTNDTHGHDVAVQGSGDTKGNFSMAAVPALKAEWEKKGYEVLLVDAGDALQGMPLVDNAKGSTAITFMNACGYDLMTVGNHEFDWGSELLAANEKAAKFPWLSANILDRQTGEPRFAAHKIMELADGTKVGFFGLTTPSAMSTSSPEVVGGFTFLKEDELYSCAEAQVRELRDEGCSLVICVGHLGNAESMGGTSKDVLSHVKGIDLFIDGHDHEEVQEEVEGTLLVETGCYLHNIGVVAIDKGAPVENLIAAGSFEGVDTSVQTIIDEEDSRVSSGLAVVLGSTPFLLNGERSPGVRTRETNLGDFVCEAFRWTANKELGYEVDAGLLSGGGIRTSIEAGDITLKDIKAVLPYSNELMVLKVTGAQLLEALEAACQAVGREKGLGAFPQVSRITFVVDASVPYEEGPLYPDSTYASPAKPGARVTIVDVGGRGFSESETYTVATCSFMCEGGDTYYAFKQASDAEKPVAYCFDYEAFASYLVEGCDHEVTGDYAEPKGYITIQGI